MKRIALLLVFCIVTTGCGKTLNTKKEFPFKGKFVVERSAGKKIDILLIDKISTRELAHAFSQPVWSKDGKKLLVKPSSRFIKLLIADEMGNILDEMPSGQNGIIVQDWLGDNKVALIEKEKLNDHWDMQYKLYTYDFDTKNKTFIYQFELNQYPYSMRASPDGARVAVQVGGNVAKPNAEDMVAIIDLRDGSKKNLSPKLAQILGWFPDGKHILISANIKDDKSKFNDAYGILGKIDVETGNLAILRNVPQMWWREFLSKDGKYVYYSRNVGKGGGQAFFIRALLDFEKEHQITFPERIGNTDSYTQDTFASWHQS